MASTSKPSSAGKQTQEPVPNRDRLLEAVLAGAKRKNVPIRKSFVQQGRGVHTRPGPLAGLVSRGDERALDAYLLAHAAASADPWDCTWPASTWVLLLDLTSSAEVKSAKPAVSKVFSRLAKTHRLVSVSRQGRRSSVVILNEDGSGSAYTRPKTRDDPWFSLPHTYWLNGYDQSLSLSAKAMLLVTLYSKDGSWLPAEYSKAWFGISPSTARAGLAELCEVGLLTRHVDYKPDARSPTMWAEKVTYRRAGDLKAKRAAAAGTRPTKAAARSRRARRDEHASEAAPSPRATRIKKPKSTS